MKNYFLVLIGLLFLFVSCGSGDEDEYLSEEAGGDSTVYQSSGGEGEEGYRPSEGKTELWYIADLMGRKRYKEALDAIYDDSNIKVRYLKGMINFCLMLNKTIDVEDRKAHYNEARSILGELSENSQNERIKIKAILWNGMASHVFEIGPDSKQTALSAFKTIQDKYADSHQFKASLYYSYLVHKHYLENDVANEFLDELKKSQDKEGTIFDPYTNTPLDWESIGMEAPDDSEKRSRRDDEEESSATEEPIEEAVEEEAVDL